MSAALTLKNWVKAREHPLARLAYGAVKGAQSWSIPVVPGLHAGLYLARKQVLGGFLTLKRQLWDTPLFLSQIAQRPRALHLYGGIPLLLGHVRMSIGEGCRISGQITISGRNAGLTEPQLIIGKNCDIGWQTTLAVGRVIRMGDNVRLAGRAFLAGYPGHPLEAQARAAGLPDHEEQIGDIILEDDVWLATGVTVSAGVTIGRGTIVAAGSVVTKDLPPFVLAGGVPARVIRSLEQHHIEPVRGAEPFSPSGSTVSVQKKEDHHGA